MAGKGKTYIRIILGKVMYIVPEKRPAAKLSGFCGFLRKHLDQARISSIEQPVGERIVCISCAAKEGSLMLVIELFGKGNIMLLKESIIMGCAEEQQWKDRVVKHGEKYVFAKREQFSGALKNLSAETLVKGLAVDAGLGGIYAEEICSRTKINKNTLTKAITTEEQKKLVAAWNELHKESILGYCIYRDKTLIDVVPVRLQCYEGFETKEFQTYSEALAFAYSQASETVEQAEMRKKKEKFMTIIREQEANISAWETEREEALKTAEWMYHHYQEVKDAMLMAKDALGKNKPLPKEIKEIKRKERKVVVEL